MPLTSYQPIIYGSDRLNIALPPPCRWPQCSPGISIGTLNIRYGRGFGLAQAILTVERGVFDVMLLTKTKIQKEAYSHNRLGYDVTCLTARPSSAGGAQGGIGTMKRERSIGWGIESMRYHGRNVVSCKIVTVRKRTPLVGAYLPPLTLEHMPDLE